MNIKSILANPKIYFFIAAILALGIVAETTSTDLFDKKIHISIIDGLLIVLFAGVGFYLTAFPINTASKSSRPMIRKWIIDNVIAICAEKDYQEWKIDNQHVWDAKTRAKKTLPAPAFTAFFTDDQQKQWELGEFVTGSIADCQQLEAKCHVENSELFIPSDPFREGRFCPVDLEDAYLRICGKAPREWAEDHPFRAN